MTDSLHVPVPVRPRSNTPKRSPSPLIVARLPSISPEPLDRFPPRRDRHGVKIDNVRSKHVHRNGQVFYTVEWNDGIVSTEGTNAMPSADHAIQKFETQSGLYKKIPTLQEAYDSPVNVFLPSDYRPQFGYLSHDTNIVNPDDLWLRQHLTTVQGGELTLKKSLHRQLYRPPGFEPGFDEDDIYSDDSMESISHVSREHSHAPSHSESHVSNAHEGLETKVTSFLMADFGDDSEDEDGDFGQ